MRNLFLVCFSLVFTSVLGQSPRNLFQEGGGRVVLNKSSEIIGNDFIYDDWNKGLVVLDDSIFSVQDYLRYDVLLDRVLLKNMNNLEEIIEIDDNTLTGFSIIEHKNNIKHDFVSLKKINFLNEANNGFYEIVFNLQNTNYFIKKNLKEIYDPNKSKGTQIINNEPLKYEDKVIYYIKNGEELYVKVRLKKNDVLAVLNNNKSLVENYIKANKIKFSKEADVMKLVNYYYSL
ncbi:hypothetical protein [Lutibacter flavus]|uniref:Uncharacterized protein n=1 Tax=Lutibacter flavus TaxID=691689 RepID=A0A238Y0Z8_9FLAO|nr:hypothetical protein [Lutibacter flavus]SNR64488.1 hypothetical protein SAMN04488111_2255 [Lutibacter flavus]